MKTTEEKIDELRRDFNREMDSVAAKFKKELEALSLADGKAAEPKKGEWWWISPVGTSCSKDALICYNGTDDDYGFNHNWNWSNSFGSLCSLGRKAFKHRATTSETEKALIAEAERKGFEEGVKFYGVNHNTGKVSDSICLVSKYNTYQYYPDNDVLCRGGNLYCRGVWATILKDTPVTIAGEKVEYCEDIVNGADYVKIKGVSYSKKELQTLLVIMERGQIKSLNAGCSGDRKITASDIQNLLDKWPV